MRVRQIFGILTRMNNTDKAIATIAEWLDTGSINFFGLPFAGKDTHGRELAGFFNAPLLGGGDILRNSVIPPHVKEALDNGRLAPIDEYIQIVTPYLKKSEFQGKPLVLSSVGRWSGEEEGVMGALEASNHPLKAVIFLNIDTATMKQRWQASQEKMDRSGRVDDAEHILDTRIAEFTEKTLPVIDYYRQAGLLIEIDSRIPKPEVTRIILEQLLQRAEKK